MVSVALRVITCMGFFPRPTSRPNCTETERTEAATPCCQHDDHRPTVTKMALRSGEILAPGKILAPILDISAPAVTARKTVPAMVATSTPHAARAGPQAGAD